MSFSPDNITIVDSAAAIAPLVTTITFASKYDDALNRGNPTQPSVQVAQTTEELQDEVEALGYLDRLKICIQPKYYLACTLFDAEMAKKQQQFLDDAERGADRVKGWIKDARDAVQPYYDSYTKPAPNGQNNGGITQVPQASNPPQQILVNDAGCNGIPPQGKRLANVPVYSGSFHVDTEYCLPVPNWCVNPKGDEYTREITCSAR